MSLKTYETNLSLARISEYQGAKKVIFGTGSVESFIGLEVKRFGKRVGLITDKGIEKVGIAEKVIDLIKKENVEVDVHNDIASEPNSESVRKAVVFGREGGYDVIVGVGGGAVMDTAKMVAVCITNADDLMTYVNPAQDMIKFPTKPKIMIPTTSGTGSEVSPYSVVIEGMYKTWAASPNLYAETAIVDPLMAMSCPPKQTAGSAMDALSHNVEALISAYSNPISDSQAIEATRLIFKYARRAYHDGKDLEARWGMSCAAMLGGIVIGYPWIGGPAILGHCIAEAAGPRWNIPHGIACGMVLPYVLGFNLPACFDKIARFAWVTGADVHGLSTREAAKVAISQVVNLMKDLDLPLTLKEFGVPKNELSEFSDYIVNERQYVYGLPTFNPRKLTEENTKLLMEHMYEGIVLQE